MHEEKAELPMLVRLLGSEIDVSALQPQNAESPIDVTFSGMEIEEIEVQLWNAPSPMEVTFVGKTIDVFPPGHCTRQVRFLSYRAPSTLA